jgi:hypothetical protein
MAAMTLPSVAGEPKTKAKIKKEFRAEAYRFNDIDTVAIYTLHGIPPAPKKSGRRPVWRPKMELPSDSVCMELANEIAKSISRRDSTVSVIVLPRRDSAATDSSLRAFARDSIGADAVFFAETIESYTERSSPGMTLPAFGGGTFTSGGHQAQAKAKILFSIQDARSGELVWSVTCETKYEAGGGGFFDLEGQPAPAVETAVAVAYTAAMSKLPF